MRKQGRLVSQIIYSLKREWGGPITVHRPLIDEQNVLTGKVHSRYEDFHIRRAIILPYDTSQPKALFRTYTAASKNFAFGGSFDETTTLIIIDVVDLPKSFSFKNTDYLIINNLTYRISEYTKTSNANSYILSVTTIEAP